MSIRSPRLFLGAILALVFILALPAIVLAHPLNRPSSGEVIHRVQRGETLAAIANRYRTTVAQLMAYNGLRNPNLIYVGQRLRIPTVAPASSTTSSTSDSPATTEGQVHIVRPGEYLALIARRYGVTVAALMRENGLRNSNLLYAGQRLRIPAGNSSTPPRPAPAPAPEPQPVHAPAGEKWIDINVTTQTLSAYEGDKLVFTTKVSTGTRRYPTVLGKFRIRTKLRSQTMAGPGYYLPNVPYVMYFYAGYAIHGTYWHNDFGRPRSHGCVNLSIPDAKWLYEWAPIGTLVITHR
ncbi:MAG: LysM peptidoglycan-binding domain-containing protein [Anaerolineae bacterium]|nr:LysM peptidoglycan-binding domain-containing protein [Anaerolineae bacterium]MDW8098508.1 LysM peptidoglycan-binding domain-containing protein [Anaerolineae bacterium]